MIITITPASSALFMFQKYSLSKNKTKEKLGDLYKYICLHNCALI